MSALCNPQEIDSGGNNQIDPAELKAAMASMGVTLKEKEVKAMMEEAHEDGDGFIDIEEFANLVKAEVDRWPEDHDVPCDPLVASSGSSLQSSSASAR